MIFHAYAIVGGLATGAAVTGTLGTARPTSPALSVSVLPGHNNTTSVEPEARASSAVAEVRASGGTADGGASADAAGRGVGKAKDEGGALARVSAAIVLPANTSARRADEASVSSIGAGGAVGERSAGEARGNEAARATVIRSDAVRRAGESGFSLSVPRSPIFGFARRNHLVAFGQFPPVTPTGGCAPSAKEAGAATAIMGPRRDR